VAAPGIERLFDYPCYGPGFYTTSRDS